MSLESELLAQRHDRIREIEALGYRSYGQRFDFTHTVPDIQKNYSAVTAEQLEADRIPVAIAGRIHTMRRMGKAGFAHLLQLGEKLQVYVRKDVVSEREHSLYQLLDIGDIIGVTGYLFRTRTGELSVHVETITFLSKTLLSMPEKFHGLEDVETRYRQRYLDLIANPDVQRVFVKRARIISSLRRQLEERGFVEVETPMMQPLYGGATARPFVTHHNTLDIDLYLRIAPELYLKRLVVGGLDRVYEINRNFRNEGVSTQHNPEFTMLEFYQSYATWHDLLPLVEQMIGGLALELTGSTVVSCGEHRIDLGPGWRRLSLLDETARAAGCAVADLRNPDLARQVAQRHGLAIPPGAGAGGIATALFEHFVEPGLLQPTFVTGFPAEVSPLARASDDDPFVVDRFELYVVGRELANGFSELNDPDDQRARFLSQLESRARGDGEAHPMDEDYVHALEHGMAPAAGCGVGIDRLVMLLCNAPSIRDVILFPLLRPTGKS